MIDRITCPRCGWTSHHPEDVRQLFCGRCHRFHDTMLDELRRELQAAVTFLATPRPEGNVDLAPSLSRESWNYLLCLLGLPALKLFYDQVPESISLDVDAYVRGYRQVVDIALTTADGFMRSGNGGGARDISHVYDLRETLLMAAEIAKDLRERNEQ